MSAVTIKLDRTARALTRCAAILSFGLRRAATSRVLTRFSIVVRHGILLKNSQLYGVIKSSTLNHFPRNRGGNARVVLKQRDIGS